MQASKEVLISEVFSRRSLWKDDDVNFRGKDVTNKQSEKVASMCV